jgi:dihydroorotate dehydrogenase electron transfer subunit
MLQERAEILWNRQVGPSAYKIGLACSRQYAQARPGQFVMLGFSGRLDPFLRRPFSIHSVIPTAGVDEAIELLYKVVGKATQTLCLQQPGKMVNLLGPLGNGFRIPADARRIYLAAGGIGVAPLLFLVSRLYHGNIAPVDCRLFLGGRTKDDILCRDDFLKLGVSISTTTDDGSDGDQCLVTQPLEIAIEQCRPDIVYACGPAAMLACVVGIAEKNGLPCQVSIETMMACGMGACLGCAIESRIESGKYWHGCVDGPVFDAKLLKF